MLSWQFCSAERRRFAYHRQAQIRLDWVLLLGVGDIGCGPTAPYPTGGPIESVLILAATLDPVVYVQVGDTLRLWAVALDRGGAEVASSEVAARTWTLSASELAQLDPQQPSGREVLVSGLLPGTVTVSASILGVRGTIDVTVLPPLGSVVLIPAATELAVGDSVFIKAIVTDVDGHELSGLQFDWLFGDANVAAFRDIGIPSGLRFYALAPGIYILGVRIAHVTGEPATIQVVPAAPPEASYLGVRTSVTTSPDHPARF